jgi:hypothetical protein
MMLLMRRSRAPRVRAADLGNQVRDFLVTRLPLQASLCSKASKRHDTALIELDGGSHHERITHTTDPLPSEGRIHGDQSVAAASGTDNRWVSELEKTRLIFWGQQW